MGKKYLTKAQSAARCRHDAASPLAEIIRKLGTSEQSKRDEVQPSAVQSERPRPLTAAMIRMLRDLRAGRGTSHGCNTPAEYRGTQRTYDALRERGLIDHEGKLTTSGIDSIRHFED